MDRLCFIDMLPYRSLVNVNELLEDEEDEDDLRPNSNKEADESGELLEGVCGELVDDIEEASPLPCRCRGGVWYEVEMAPFG